METGEAGYPGWRSCLADPGLASETPVGFLRWRAGGTGGGRGGEGLRDGRDEGDRGDGQ